ncbi:adhesion G protein-coupled receptor B2 [Trichonephila clavipes]|nr:adhesion G protein-coupled receptor B2 [Trichonephila clavipes]
MEYRLSEYSSTERKVDEIEKDNVMCGTMVIVKEDFTPVCNWLLGRVVEVYHGKDFWHRTAPADSDVVQSGRPIFDDFSQHLWPYIGNNTANVVFQMVKRLWLIRIDQ